MEHFPVKTDARPFLLSLHSIMEPSQFLACLATLSVYSFIFSRFTILLPCPNEELSSLLLNCWSLFLARRETMLCNESGKLLFCIHSPAFMSVVLLNLFILFVSNFLLSQSSLQLRGFTLKCVGD